MAHDGTNHEEAEYEVKRRERGRVKIDIYLPNQRRPIQHGIKVSDIVDHPGDEAAAIEDRVQRIASQHTDPGDELDLPEGGKAVYDPEARDGTPSEDTGSSDPNQETQ